VTPAVVTPSRPTRRSDTGSTLTEVREATIDHRDVAGKMVLCGGLLNNGKRLVHDFKAWFMTCGYVKLQ